MNTRVTLSELRSDLYRLADQVLDSGEPLEIARKGRTLRLVADPMGDRLSRIQPIPGLIVGDPDSLAELDWSDEWRSEDAG
ncbi:MAG TPA: hypothetical protein VNQ48_03625 [Microbacteriaceae bacterium]|nr:hypothetical protein [Microbacteriaceae bacterium]